MYVLPESAFLFPSEETDEHVRRRPDEPNHWRTRRQYRAPLPTVTETKQEKPLTSEAGDGE